MGHEGSKARGLPRLDEFDQEFGHEPDTIILEDRSRISWRLVAAGVAIAVLISLPALAWLNADGLRSLVFGSSAASQSTENSAEQLARLTHEIARLKHELGDLVRAHQQAIERIASLQADQELRQSAPISYWYSDMTALSYESIGQPRPSAVLPPPRRAVTARPEGRENRRGEPPEPLSLEAPQ